MADHAQSLKDIWTKSFKYRTLYQTPEEIESVLALLRLEAGTTLVDVGCGNGAFAIAATRRFPDLQVLAYDILDSAVMECRARAADLPGKNLRAEAAQADSIPLPDGYADRVLMRNVLHHIPDADAVYGELNRLLAPSGILVLQTPCNFWETEYGEFLKDLHMIIDDSHERYFRQSFELVEGLERAGFIVERVECWRYPFPFEDEEMIEYILNREAGERLRLRSIEHGKWMVEMYWCRLVAMKEDEGDAFTL
jgi:ubiquinone/menaquinone biosynthesis C-methylase UbiE